MRIYDVRKVIETVADTGSVLEIRRHWIVSALRSVPDAQRRTGEKRPCVDTW